jgi:hypothetical protein
MLLVYLNVSSYACPPVMNVTTKLKGNFCVEYRKLFYVVEKYYPNEYCFLLYGILYLGKAV